jgi:hypothetical protein
VFVGGAIRGLLVTDPGAAEARPTDDVDVVLEVATYFHYREVELQLHALGFVNDTRPRAPACRYLHGPLVLDLMPTNESVLGFSNAWYSHAVATAVEFDVKSSRRPALRINVISAPCFVATKLVAFRDRGGGDLLHHDIEDIIAVIDGRASLAEEIAADSSSLRAFIAEQLTALIADGLASGLRGHLAHDASGDLRLPILLRRIEEIARAK